MIFKIHKKNKRIARLSLISLPIVTLLMILNFSDPINSAKLIPTTIIGSILFGHLISNRLKNRQLIDIFAFLFVLGLIISFSQSDNLYIAFFGDIQRKNGLLLYLCFVSIFIGIYKNVSFNDTIYFEKIIYFLSLVLIPYGYLQHFKLDFIKWKNPYNPIILTVGNPNFASAVLGIICVLHLAFIFEQKKFVYKLFSILFLNLGFILIVLTDSRQGLIVFAFGGFLVLIFHIRNINKRFGNLLLFFFSLIIFLSFFGLRNIGPLKTFLYKDSIGVRFYYWKAAWQMFLANPVFGIGLDRYQYNFRLFREQKYALDYGYQISSSNAHNIFLQFLSTGGIVVAIPYLLLIGFVFVKSTGKLISATKSTNRIYGVYGAWFGFQAQSFISIDSAGIAIWGWVLSGLLIAELDSPENEKEKIKFKNLSRFSTMKTSAVLASGICGILGSILSAQIYIGERVAFESRIIDVSNQTNLNNVGQKLLKLWIVDPSYKIELAQRYYESGLIAESDLILKKLIAEDNKNLDALAFFAWSKEMRSIYEEAIEYRQKIFKLDPFGVPNLLSLGLDFKKMGRFEEMKSVREKILRLVPNSDYSREAATLLIP